jgi:pyruvate formate lyase activating enzyme
MDGMALAPMVAKTGGADSGSNRHALNWDATPTAPETRGYADAAGTHGYVHSWDAGAQVDGPGSRMTIFTSGCLLRCQYCHNPDTWHLRDGNRREASEMLRVIAKFAPALRALQGGLTISGGEPLVQLEFTRRLFRGARELGLHTALDTSGFLGADADDDYLDQVSLVLLDIKSSDPATYLRVTGKELAPTLAFAERLAALGKPVWVRFVLVPGLTDTPDNIDGIARFVAPMANVEWIEVLPFHQLGAYKWKALGLDYRLRDHVPCPPEAVARAIDRFRALGCRAR